MFYSRGLIPLALNLGLLPFGVNLCIYFEIRIEDYLVSYTDPVVSAFVEKKLFFHHGIGISGTFVEIN